VKVITGKSKICICCQLHHYIETREPKVYSDGQCKLITPFLERAWHFPQKLKSVVAILGAVSVPARGDPGPGVPPGTLYPAQLCLQGACGAEFLLPCSLGDKLPL